MEAPLPHASHPVNLDLCLCDSPTVDAAGGVDL